MKTKTKTTNNMVQNPIILFLVKFGFSDMIASDKVVKALDVVTRMTGNTNFPTPTPALASITAAADALYTALQNLDGTRMNTSIKNNMEKALDDKMRAIAAYVQSASDGDKVKIESSGLTVRELPNPVGLLGPVTDLTATLGDYPGTVDLKWKPIKKGILYVVEQTNNMFPANWELIGESTKARIIINDLQSGQIVSFRIACITSAGVGPYSEAISIKVY